MMSKVDICKYNPQDYKSVCVPARLGDLFGLQMMVWSGMLFLLVIEKYNFCICIFLQILYLYGL